MKRFVFRMFYYLGIPAVVRFFHRHSLTIVLYHGVAPQENIGIFNYRGKFIAPKSFEEHLAYINTRYHVLALEDALERMQHGTLPPYALAITFDDGYKNFADFAHPILSRYEMPATMFLASEFVLRKTPLWVDRLEYSIGSSAGSYEERTRTDERERARLKTLPTQESVADLARFEKKLGTSFIDFSGDRAVFAPLTLESIHSLARERVTFGAHTRTHPILSCSLPEEQQSEIIGSRQDLEHAGIRVSNVFAYPNGQKGDWDTHTMHALKDAHMTHALTTLEGFNTNDTNPYELRRIVLDGTDDFATFANVLSGVRLWLKLIRSFI
jgi:peptidoglycan/xylan/chitin deacetylase (PgdA/CDA1 family)